MESATMQHHSVLLEQSVAALVTDKNGFYVDGTFGRGGHSRRILKELSERVTLEDQKKNFFF